MLSRFTPAAAFLSFEGQIDFFDLEPTGVIEAVQKKKKRWDGNVFYTS